MELGKDSPPPQLTRQESASCPPDPAPGTQTESASAPGTQTDPAPGTLAQGNAIDPAQGNPGPLPVDPAPGNPLPPPVQDPPPVRPALPPTASQLAQIFTLCNASFTAYFTCSTRLGRLWLRLRQMETRASQWRSATSTGQRGNL